MYRYSVRLDTDVSPRDYSPFFKDTSEEYPIKLEAGRYIITLNESTKDGKFIPLQPSKTETVPEPVDDNPPSVDGKAILEFRNLENSYNVGERVEMELVEAGNRNIPVDLWVAIEGSGTFNFLSETDVQPKLEPQFYKKIPVDSADTSHTIAFEFPKDFNSGKYTFYAAYVEEDKEPITDGTPNEYIRSSVSQEIELKANTEPPAGENLAELKFDGLEDSYNVGDQVVMKLVEARNRNIPVDLWVAIQLPSGEILFRTDVPLSFWAPWSPNLQPHKTSIESTDTNHHIFDFELPEGIGGNYTLFAVYVEEGKKPVNDKGLDEKLFRSNFVKEEIVLAKE
jgi:hypothetical protein